jgi:hypothetical protein
MTSIRDRAIANFLPPAGPLRRIASGTLLTSVGDGAWYASWAIFLTRSVGLSPAQVGLGMTAAGAVALLLAIPIGHLADLVGPREVFAGMLIMQGIGTVSYLAVHSFALFLPVACLAVTGDHSSGGASKALVLGAAGEGHGTWALGSVRAVSQIGWAAGAAVGAIVIAIGTRSAFAALVTLDAATCFGYAAVIARLPRRETGSHVPVHKLTVLRDGPYLTLAALMGVMALCWGMLSSGLPLWIVFHTHAPRSIAAVIVVINALVIGAFQLRIARGISSPLAAVRAAMCSGSALAASCLLFALTDHQGGFFAVALLLGAGGLHVIGELWFVGASWGLSISLMPASAPGQYQGVFAAGEATALMIAPALMTLLVVSWGQPGWIALGALFLVAPAIAAPATRWALHTRPVLATTP